MRVPLNAIYLPAKILVTNSIYIDFPPIKRSDKLHLNNLHSTSILRRILINRGQQLGHWLLVELVKFQHYALTRGGGQRGEWFLKMPISIFNYRRLELMKTSYCTPTNMLANLSCQPVIILKKCHFKFLFEVPDTSIVLSPFVPSWSLDNHVKFWSALSL